VLSHLISLACSLTHLIREPRGPRPFATPADSPRGNIPLASQFSGLNGREHRWRCVGKFRKFPSDFFGRSEVFPQLFGKIRYFGIANPEQAVDNTVADRDPIREAIVPVVVALDDVATC
jgi:hypothetical protein